MIADPSPKALQEVSDRIAEVGGEVHTTEVDIGDDASVAAMARWSVETIGAPDILLVTVIGAPRSKTRFSFFPRPRG